jgi:MFS family permease
MAVVIPKWFIVKRGRAIGFAGIGQRSGQTLFPLIAERATVAGSWRTGWVVLGVLVWTVALIPTLLFMRRKPEDMRLLPDGVKPEEVRVSTVGWKAQGEGGRGLCHP